jgi:hypothetical protein
VQCGMRRWYDEETVLVRFIERDMQKIVSGTMH